MNEPANPFAALCSPVEAPAWGGPKRLHRLLDDEAPAERQADPEDWTALEALQRRAARAVLLVLPAWKLIRPGSQHEALAAQVSPALWWPFPGEEF